MVNAMCMSGCGAGGLGRKAARGRPRRGPKDEAGRARAPPIGGQLGPPCPPSLTLASEARAAALPVSAGAANAEVAARARTRKATRMVEEVCACVWGLVFFFVNVRAHPALHPCFSLEGLPAGVSERVRWWTRGRAGLFLYSVQLSLPRGQPHRPCGRGAGVAEKKEKRQGEVWGEHPPNPSPRLFLLCSLSSLSPRGNPHYAQGWLHAPLLVFKTGSGKGALSRVEAGNKSPRPPGRGAARAASP